MANLIPDGEYYIYAYLNKNLVLDMAGSTLSGTNINVELRNSLKNNAQVFQVRNVGSNQIVITSRFSGKRLAPTRAGSGAGVVLNPAKNQSVPTDMAWTVGSTADNITLDGKSYACFTLSFSNLFMGSSGMATGSRIQLSTIADSYARWAFVQINQVKDTGLFEIRSAVDPMYALDVENHGTINGANVQIYPGTGYNNQKFVIEKKATDSYAIRNINSSKYLYVDGTKAGNGQNISIWESNNKLAQRWKIYEYGTTVHDGLECNIVSFGSYITANADTYFMDVYAGNAQPFENVRIFARTETDAQRFLLQPTEAEDPSMPTPYNIGVSLTENGSRRTYGYTGKTCIPTWSCSAAWCNQTGTNHYQIRYRTRYMNSNTSSWKSWGAWSTWFIPQVETSGTRVWFDDIPFIEEYSWNTAKCQQVEIQVRSSGDDGLELLHSLAGDQVVTIYRMPKITISSGEIGWSPDGITLGYTTDYAYGTTYLYIDSIIDKETGENILKEPIETSTSIASNSLLIDRSKISKWLDDEASIEIHYRVGYDQQKECNWNYWCTRTITYDAGNIDVEPVLSKDGRHLYARVPHLGTERIWVQYDGKLIECPSVGTTGTGMVYTLFDILYPTDGSEFFLYTEARSEDGSYWGTDISKAHYKFISYAWTVGTDTYFLQISQGDYPVYTHSHDATYQADILDSREHASVSIAPTTMDELTAYGVLVHDERYADPETPADFEGLVGKHAIFRDITGGIHDVAITSVTISESVLYDEITVQMIEETV